jgi:hypothetical protein
MVNGQLTWLISKGDLVLSDEPKEEQRDFGFNFQEKDERKISLPVYEYPDEDGPDSYYTAKDGKRHSFSRLRLKLLNNFRIERSGPPSV